MKTLLITLGLALLLNNTVNAAVECQKEGRYWYPKNEKAKQIATMLKVKTCNGKRFKQVVAKLNEKSNVTTTKQYSVDDIVKKLGK